MAFAPIFQRPFSATFDRRAAAAAAPWWLAGGAPTPVAVYQPKGAASLAASYVNKVTPGTHDCVGTVAPSLGANGWIFTGTEYLSIAHNAALNFAVPFAIGIRLSFTTAANLVVFEKNHNIGFSVQVDNKLVKTNVGATATSMSCLNYLNDGNLHVVFFLLNTVGTPGGNVYVDGVLNNSPTWNGISAPPNYGTNTTEYIGSRAGSFSFVGTIAELVTYSTTVTDAQAIAVSTAMAAL